MSCLYAALVTSMLEAAAAHRSAASNRIRSRNACRSGVCPPLCGCLAQPAYRDDRASSALGDITLQKSVTAPTWSRSSLPAPASREAAWPSGPRLLLRYLLPGVVPALLIGASLDVANVIMTMSLMSFLGLGLPAPAPELGAMTSRTLDSLTVHWWLPILPAAIIFLLCLLANLSGDGIRAALRGA